MKSRYKVSSFYYFAVYSIDLRISILSISRLIKDNGIDKRIINRLGVIYVDKGAG